MMMKLLSSNIFRVYPSLPAVKGLATNPRRVNCNLSRPIKVTQCFNAKSLRRTFPLGNKAKIWLWKQDGPCKKAQIIISITMIFLPSCFP